MEDGRDEPEGEVDLAFDGVDDGEMAGDGVGAHQGKHVWEGGDDGAEVGLGDAVGSLVPLFWGQYIGVGRKGLGGSWER